ncbi:hypothetical protein EYF80_061570 [Liparis tanakae]|uniref:Uncharacterized protein n=1 Tax=Liparis tanakae TaxID=230148 RepID=A0A4Z2EI34_9TELE|nr:hypothetical protein EYF80_061570 [Liparis tanakae]
MPNRQQDGWTTVNYNKKGQNNRGRPPGKKQAAPRKRQDPSYHRRGDQSNHRWRDRSNYRSRDRSDDRRRDQSDHQRRHQSDHRSRDKSDRRRRDPSYHQQRTYADVTKNGGRRDASSRKGQRNDHNNNGGRPSGHRCTGHQGADTRPAPPAHHHTATRWSPAHILGAGSGPTHLHHFHRSGALNSGLSPWAPVRGETYFTTEGGAPDHCPTHAAPVAFSSPVDTETTEAFHQVGKHHAT